MIIWLATLTLVVGTQSASNAAPFRLLGHKGNDVTTALQKTADRGYVLVGHTDSQGSGDEDGWIIKLDDKLLKQWEKTYGGSGRDSFSSVQQTRDGGFIVVGQTKPSDSRALKPWAIKLDAKGDMMWSRTYTEVQFGNARAVLEEERGGYVLAGTIEGQQGSRDDVWLAKTDRDGKLEWSKTFGLRNSDYTLEEQFTFSGGFVFTGSGYTDRGSSLVRASDGGFIIAGTTGLELGHVRALLLKTDPRGNIEWHRTYGRTGFTRANHLISVSSGGYLVAGSTDEPNAAHTDFLVLRLDQKGNVLWQQIFGGSAVDEANSAQETTDGGFIICGGTLSYETGTILIVKTDPSGNERWRRVILGSPHRNYKACFIHEGRPGEYIIAATTELAEGQKAETVILKLDAQGAYLELTK